MGVGWWVACRIIVLSPGPGLCHSQSFSEILWLTLTGPGLDMDLDRRLQLSRFNKNLLKLKKNTIFQNIFIELKSSKHLINPCHLFERITLPVLSISRCWHWMGWQKPSSFESNELWGKHGKCPRPATQTIINPRPARTLCKIDNRINFYRISYLLTPVAGYK